MNACNKGKAGEREAAHYLTELFGLTCSRGAQHAGGVESPDIKGIPGLHFEVKRVQALNLGAAMAQAERDAGGALVPVVMHRRNREGWRLTIQADDLWRFVEAVQNAPGPFVASKPGVEPSKTPDASCAKIDVVRCVGDGGEDGGCGYIGGKSGFACPACNGMLLSDASIRDAIIMAEEWAKSVALALDS